eukprot:CAMPEP_0195283510 /NCGR_PEP_ID=MMETSP0707-20130614/2035_1 /TAXON_ID=33640 /ORGANISM="Asterionellopsis glacialis, Strain CCMP134" /LENGTH=601 /DNA_ID=CAMNT_0040342691 /DNA_START=104 /DNA_END=1909 /DNA_ORIENTATION=+
MSSRRAAVQSSSLPHHEFGYARTRKQGNTTHVSNQKYRNNHLYHDHNGFQEESTYKNCPAPIGSKQQQSSSTASAPPIPSPNAIPPVARARSTSGSIESDEESVYQSMLKYQRNSATGSGSIWQDKPGLKDISHHHDDDNSSDMDRKPPAIPSPLLARKTKSLVSARSGSSTSGRGMTDRNTQKGYGGVVRHDVVTIPGEMDRREIVWHKGGDMNRPPNQKQKQKQQQHYHRHDGPPNQKQQQHYHRHDNDDFNDLSELRIRRSEKNNFVINDQKGLYKSIQEEQKHQERLCKRINEMKIYEETNPTLTGTTSLSMYPQRHYYNDLLNDGNDGSVLIGPKGTRTTRTTDPYYSTEVTPPTSKKQLDIWNEIKAEQDQKQLEKALSISRQEKHHITGGEETTQALNTIGSSSSRSEMPSTATETLVRDFLMRNDPQRREEKVSSADFLISQQLAMEELETNLHQHHAHFASSTTTTGVSQSSANLTSTVSRYRTAERQNNTNINNNNNTSNGVFLHDVLQRGHLETKQAISRGESHIVRCKGCSARLHAPVGYSLIYCPTCHAVSPGASISNMETLTYNYDEEHGHVCHQTNVSASLCRKSG